MIRDVYEVTITVASKMEAINLRDLLYESETLTETQKINLGFHKVKKE